jgi:hypothetical protein
MVYLSAMKYTYNKLIRLLSVFIPVLFFPEKAIATQTHGGIEGVVVHQIAHIVFIGAMALLIYWLRQHELVINLGWRRIQYAALFFILWNINAFFVHLIEEQVNILDIAQIGPWQLRLQTQPAFEWTAWFYFMIKLDHLLCVPAMIYLYLGLKNLIETPALEFQSGKKEGT